LIRDPGTGTDTDRHGVRPKNRNATRNNTTQRPASRFPDEGVYFLPDFLMP
jgi:hypothetical protein